jgi:ArsR family transcriptional regulator
MRALEIDHDRAAIILRTVAHPLRLRILALLCAQEHCVNAIATRLGAKATTVSQALAILRRERLVAATRRNGRARYRLEERALEKLIPWVEGLGGRARAGRLAPP